jgi:tRNA(Ile)-lysidine synthase
VVLGLSGGVDSVVLLRVLHELTPHFGWQLAAVHVHHGISWDADAWANFCIELCANYGIPLHVERVSIALLRDEHGIEAAARKLRHAVFAQMNCDFVALAHHADDQAETLLLQLLRGAGIKGAAAMPLFRPASAHGHATLRPLLGVSRGALLEYAQQHSLQWVEDDSNADDSYPRNFLRHRVLPVLEQKFPAYRTTLARSAEHFAESGELLDELAQQDAQGWVAGAPLEIALLRALSPARGKNLLRYVLQRQGALLPHAMQLHDMLRQLCAARQDAAVCIRFGAWQLRRYQGRAYVMPVLGEFERKLVLPCQVEEMLVWPPLKAQIRWERTQGKGICLEKLKRAPLSLRLRSGGESLRSHVNATSRSLKNLLQEHHLPPWQRERLPLLYCGDELVSVIGVAIAAEYQAEPQVAGVHISVVNA